MEQSIKVFATGELVLYTWNSEAPERPCLFVRYMIDNKVEIEDLYGLCPKT